MNTKMLKEAEVNIKTFGNILENEHTEVACKVAASVVVGLSSIVTGALLTIAHLSKQTVEKQEELE